MPNAATPKSSPGKNVTIYMRREVHAAATKRAFAMNISLSRYLELIHIRSEQRTKGF